VSIILLEWKIRMNPAFTLCSKDSGIMEYWNYGMMVPLKNPIFQHSIIPGSQRGYGQ